MKQDKQDFVWEEQRILKKIEEEPSLDKVFEYGMQLAKKFVPVLPEVSKSYTYVLFLSLIEQILHDEKRKYFVRGLSKTREVYSILVIPDSDLFPLVSLPYEKAIQKIKENQTKTDPKFAKEDQDFLDSFLHEQHISWLKQKIDESLACRNQDSFHFYLQELRHVQTEQTRE